VSGSNSRIKNIIFDLGGVIINLDIPRTVAEFTRIAGLPFESIYSQAEQIEVFDKFDKGLVSDFDFFNSIRKHLRYNGKDEDLLKAWNAMLLDVPSHRLDMLVKLKLNYKTFLLSNTNETHITAFERDLYRQHGVKNFNDYFEAVYYSCRMGMRKPDAEIFNKVLSEQDLDPAETIFIDDTEKHVKGAGACGIRSYLLPPKMDVEDLLKELRIL
jgi:FMN phosphatase YigB (HAD superfamily)